MIGNTLMANTQVCQWNKTLYVVYLGKHERYLVDTLAVDIGTYWLCKFLCCKFDNSN